MQKDFVSIEICDGLIVKRRVADIINERLRPRIWQWSFLNLRGLLFEIGLFSRMLSGEKVTSLLDLGCGMKPYRTLFPEIKKYVGYDVSSDSQADKLGLSWDLPFANNEFDALISTQVLEHTLKVKETVSEMARVVRNGGLIFVSVPLTFPEHEIPHDYQRFTQYGLRELFGNFEIIRLVPLSGYLKTLIILWNNFLHYLPGSKYWLFWAFLFNNTLALFLDKVIFMLSWLLRKMNKKSVAWEIYDKYYRSFTESYVIVLRNKK